MNCQAETLETHLEAPMEHAAIAGTSIKVSRVAIGTWAIGGWMWGGNDEAQSISTIRAALDHGINLIDTAPVYGSAAPRRLSARRSQTPACAPRW